MKLIVSTASTASQYELLKYNMWRVKLAIDFSKNNQVNMINGFITRSLAKTTVGCHARCENFRWAIHTVCSSIHTYHHLDVSVSLYLSRTIIFFKHRFNFCGQFEENTHFNQSLAHCTV